MIHNSYTVERHDHGYLVKGTISVTDISCLFKAWEELGYTLLVPGIATALDAVAAVVADEEDHLHWEKEIQARNEKNYPSNPALQWKFGTDTGAYSKEAILHACCPQYRGNFDPAYDHHRGYTPLDSSDFGRCLRLVEKVPEVEVNLHQVGVAFPWWTPFLGERWAVMRDLYQKKEYKILNETLTRCNEEAEAIRRKEVEQKQTKATKEEIS